ncbi:4'-phosphopantetheinyl transferase superfamily protein [Sanguibacter sp. 25GB23B1]|uniref:4'-phosphopantetheinyl transferase family protein n=1 Tax=unclassified Sanguibacter TaxID=2645534 RepID=UPI0032AEF5E2
MTTRAAPVAMIARSVDVATAVPLTPAESARLGSLLDAEDQRDFTAAHSLVRACAARMLASTGRHREAASLVLVHRCPACGSPEHGVPQIDGVPGLHVSLSRSAGRVAAVAGWEPVGIDVQSRRTAGSTPGTTPALLALTLSPAEQQLVRSHDDPELAFTRLWVRKEALLKVGVGTLDALADLDVDHGAPPGRHGPWAFSTWEDDTHVAAVVARGEVRLETTGRRAPGENP